MKITVTNESSVLIKHFYYDIDYTLGDKFTEDTLYFHAYFNRENLTNLKRILNFFRMWKEKADIWERIWE